MKRGEFWKSSAVDWVNFDKSNPKRKARKKKMKIKIDFLSDFTVREFILSNHHHYYFPTCCTIWFHSRG